MFALFNLSKRKAIGTITIIINLMPQLVPFYFINQVTFAFAIIALLIFVFSKYILPRFVRLFTTRVFISKL
jgi:F-type H+-transporting ATPase subunit 8